MEQFGEYELIRKIATGGMAEIYLARQAGIEGFEKLLVLKRILPHLAESEEFVEMFLHEARIAVKLNHPNVVTIFNLGAVDGSYFIAMEYIRGEDARRLWKKSEEVGNPLPIPLACRIAIDAAAGLDYAHKKTGPSGEPLNIIHRDVSPQNILVSFQGAVKVVDFGIAKAADSTSNTRTGVLKGKYSYMSPEQATGKDIDQRTDQFALGVVLYELLTSRRLFKRSNDIQTLAAVSECRIAPPSEVSPRVPADLDPIVLKALARNPDDRYRDLAEFQMALEEWLLSTRQPSSSAHLSAFMKSIYADRLEREQASGVPVFSADGSGSSSSSVGSRVRGRTGLSKVGQGTPRTPTSSSRSAVAHRGSLVAPEPLAPPVPPEDDFEPTPVDDRKAPGGLSGGKKAALGIGVAFAVAAAALLLWPQGDPVTVGPLTGGVTGPAPGGPVVTAPKLGGVKVVTNPAGAQVFLDAKARGLSPATVGALALGEHQIFVQLEGYLDESLTVELKEDGIIEPVTISLRRDPAVPLPVQVRVDSVPSGAALTIAGKMVGRTPAVVELVAAQSVDLELVRDGYLPARRSFTPDARAEQQLTVELDRRAAPTAAMGTVIVQCEPPATVWQGSQRFGETPVEIKLPAGRHQLTLVNQQEKLEHQFSVAVKSQETVTRSFRFEQGEVFFVVKPWADVYLRGRKLGTTPMAKISLPEGEYVFTLVNTELGKKRNVPVRIRPKELEKLAIDMAVE